VSLSETGAIVQYILECYGPKASGTPMSRHVGEPDYPAYLSWLHYANGTLQPAVSRMMALMMADALRTPVAERYQQKLLGQLQMVDDRLSNSKYLAGDEVTAADVMTVFSLTTMRGFYPVDLGPYKNILRYLNEVVARPAYVEALRKGDGGMESMIRPVERQFTQFESFARSLKNLEGREK
jgi:glutathione S-transferase